MCLWHWFRSKSYEIPFFAPFPKSKSKTVMSKQMMAFIHPSVTNMPIELDNVFDFDLYSITVIADEKSRTRQACLANVQVG